MRPPWTVERLHACFDALGDLGLAALLRELGRCLYNRQVMTWRVLVEVSDELLERETFQARERLGARYEAKIQEATRAWRRAQRRSRRRA